MSSPPFGTNGSWNSTGILLRDALNGMGDFMTQEVGSLSWIEAKVMSQLCDTAFNFLDLMSNQIQPASASIYLPRWAQIYNLQGLSNTVAIQQQIQLIQSLTGTPPSLSEVRMLLSSVLGSCYIDTQWVPENQGNATIDPYTDLVVDKLQYQMPLANFFVYIWQPRDNQDNLLMSNAQFTQVIQSYQTLLNTWLPHFTQVITMNLVNRGNNDGYGTGQYGFNYNNYQDVFNVINCSAGTNVITGTNTTFTQDFFPQPGSSVLPYSIMRTPPIQIVDDTGQLQTYYVETVNSDTSMTLTTNVFNSITNRTFRGLGCVTDTPGMCDIGMLFNR